MLDRVVVFLVAEVVMVTWIVWLFERREQRYRFDKLEAFGLAVVGNVLLFLLVAQGG
jgi:hypothetical protein